MTRQRIIKTSLTVLTGLTFLLSCGSGKKNVNTAQETVAADKGNFSTYFSADSAYSYVARQVGFGPRVPGTEAHRKCGDWLVETLKGFGAEVSEQTSILTTFDGTRIPMRNIYARINPESENRILLLAHWDSRPWADNDPDPSNHKTPVDGANDGASGTGVLLELARIAGTADYNKGVDILFCDAEDWGTEHNDDSWAMGARYFASNPLTKNIPSAAILLDMVGAPDATFMREYYSQMSNPALADEIWATAKSLGHGDIFINKIGSAVNDDHVELIKAGIPAIDIIDYREGEGFFSGWHTTHDNMEAISMETLGKVGNVIETYLKK